MDTVIANTDWRPRAAGLTAQLVTQRVLNDPVWASAFAAIPRHLFTPRVVADDGAVLYAGQREWLEAVYSDAALLTQTAPAGDGEQELPTSSSSRPAVMAVMLEALDTRSGHRVLEVGTGTGYNTALLCQRLGEGNICSVDIHPGLIAQAREHLAEIGCHPCLSTGNGANGWAEHAPFDRILATCAITQIPPEWIRQLADGGRIVAPLDAGTSGPLLVLDKTAPDEVTGYIHPYPAWFMPLREHTDNP
ncbi:MAG: methyltransferase domain-containing protein [Pseudonocardiaceae bacterium]